MTRPLRPEQVAALVPCHREPPAAALLEGIAARLGGVLVVDDGMPGERPAQLDRLAARLGLDTFHLPSNLGKGFALAAGLERLLSRSAPPAGVLVLDADGQHPPAAIPRFLAASAEAELVVGNRFADGAATMPPVRLLANRLSSRLVSHLTANPVPDSQCGMRLLHGRALRIPFPPGGMDSETRHLISCLQANIPLACPPIPAIYEGEPSSFRPLQDSLAVLRAAFTL